MFIGKTLFRNVFIFLIEKIDAEVEFKNRRTTLAKNASLVANLLLPSLIVYLLVRYIFTKYSSC